MLDRCLPQSAQTQPLLLEDLLSPSVALGLLLREEEKGRGKKEGEEMKGEDRERKGRRERVIFPRAIAAFLGVCVSSLEHGKASFSTHPVKNKINWGAGHRAFNNSRL